MVAAAMILCAAPSFAQVGDACGGHDITWMGNPPRVSQPFQPKYHGPPTLPMPGWVDRETWDALVFDARDYPDALSAGPSHWRRRLPVEERHTIVLPRDDVESFRICIPSPDDSYIGERLSRFADTEWWREQVLYFTGRRWGGTVEYRECAGSLDNVPGGWIYIREGEPGEVADRFLAYTNSWYWFDPHGTISRWSRSLILWHSAEKMRNTDDEWIESTLAHELGHALGFSHVDPSSGFVMLAGGRTRVWPALERQMGDFAYRIGPGVVYPGFVDVPVPAIPFHGLLLLAGCLGAAGLLRMARQSSRADVREGAGRASGC